MSNNSEYKPGYIPLFSKMTDDILDDDSEYNKALEPLYNKIMDDIEDRVRREGPFYGDELFDNHMSFGSNTLPYNVYIDLPSDSLEEGSTTHVSLFMALGGGYDKEDHEIEAIEEKLAIFKAKRDDLRSKGYNTESDFDVEEAVLEISYEAPTSAEQDIRKVLDDVLF